MAAPNDGVIAERGGGAVAVVVEEAQGPRHRKREAEREGSRVGFGGNGGRRRLRGEVG